MTVPTLRTCTVHRGGKAQWWELEAAFRLSSGSRKKATIVLNYQISLFIPGLQPVGGATTLGGGGLPTSVNLI